MGTGRVVQTATLLSDGTVLIAGGMDKTGASTTLLATAEVFDPGTGKFAPTGSMTQARIYHTATRLLDGRVLVAGGTTLNISPVASAELYDPATGRFSPTGSLQHARSRQTASLLPDGRVLVAGGYDGSTIMASAELYDPSTGEFTTTGAMGTPRVGDTATVLRDGRVLVAGGWARSSLAPALNSLVTAELYDPTTGTFIATGSMLTARTVAVAAPLNDGRVLVVGGYSYRNDDPTCLSSAEVFEPATGKFTATGAMANCRGIGEPSAMTATPLLDGRVLIAGDINDVTRFGRRPAELYDPKTGRFGATTAMVEARCAQTGTLLPDGRVLFTGGWAPDSGGSVALSSAEVYQP
jgi:hypothetical protein